MMLHWRMSGADEGRDQWNRPPSPGIVYAVVATAAIVLLYRFPHPSLSDESVSAWYEDTAHRSGLILGLNLAAISSIAFLWFVAVIRRRIGDLEDRSFATVFFGSAIVYVGMWLVAASLLAAPAAALTTLEAGAVDQETSTFASGFAAALMLVAAPRIQAVFVLTTSTLILRTKVLPNWLAYFGYLVGIGLFTVPIVSRPVGIGLPIWVPSSASPSFCLVPRIQKQRQTPDRTAECSYCFTSWTVIMTEDIRRALETDRVVDITTIGRKTGRARRIEMWFHNVNGTVFITGMPGRRSWFANLLTNPHFTFHVKESTSADLPATATEVVDVHERRRVLAEITRRVGAAANLDVWVERSPLVSVQFAD